MINVKQEIEDVINAHGGMANVHCIILETVERDPTRYVLKVDHTAIQEEKFLENCNFEVSQHNGQMNLEGQILFKDGTWSIREYDYEVGYEFWHYYSRPSVPKDCEVD